MTRSLSDCFDPFDALIFEVITSGSFVSSSSFFLFLVVVEALFFAQFGVVSRLTLVTIFELG